MHNEVVLPEYSHTRFVSCTVDGSSASTMDPLVLVWFSFHCGQFEMGDTTNLQVNTSLGRDVVGLQVRRVNRLLIRRLVPLALAVAISPMLHSPARRFLCFGKSYIDAPGGSNCLLSAWRSRHHRCVSRSLLPLLGCRVIDSHPVLGSRCRKEQHTGRCNPPRYSPLGSHTRTSTVKGLPPVFA